MGNSPVVKERYVAVLDILGFKNLLIAADAYGRIRNIVSEIEGRIGYDDRKHPYLKYIFISDTIIILAEPGHSPHLLWKISQVQNVILRLGFLTRGALTYGEILIHPATAPSNIFGKTYVQAYEMEQKLAFYPRVIIESHLTGRMRLEFPSQPKLCFDDYVAIGPDGASYVRQFVRDISYSRQAKKKAKVSKNRDCFRSAIEAGLTGADERSKIKWYWLKTEFEREFAALA